MQLVRFLIGGFEYCMERNPCLQPTENGVHLIWRCLHDLPNNQIKTTAKYTTYTVTSQNTILKHKAIFTHISLFYKLHHPLPHDPISNTTWSILIVHYCLL